MTDDAIFTNFDPVVKQYFSGAFIRNVIAQSTNASLNLDEIVDVVNEKLIQIMNTDKVGVLKTLIGHRQKRSSSQWNYIEHAIRYTYRNDMIYFIKVYFTDMNLNDNQIIDKFTNFIYTLYNESPDIIYDMFCHQNQGCDIDWRYFLRINYNDELTNLFLVV